MFPLVIQSHSEGVVKGFAIPEIDSGGSLLNAQCHWQSSAKIA